MLTILYSARSSRTVRSIATSLSIPGLIGLLLVLTVPELTNVALARDGKPPEANRSFRLGEGLDGFRAASGRAHTRSDTLDFGNVDEAGFARLGGIWDFDTETFGDPAQGWYATDLTEQSETFFQQITAGSWSDQGSLVAAPILSGDGSIWLGATEDRASELCWQSGLGYGNSWCQRLISPELEYSGAGTIQFEMDYFNDTELNFDYVRVILLRLPGSDEVTLNGEGFTGRVGLSPSHPNNPPIGSTYVTSFDTAELQGDTRFQIVFQMESDAVWSDEDGDYPTEYGPFGADDVEMSGALVDGTVSYQFEDDLDGWSAGPCPGIGSLVGFRDLSHYSIEDPCACEIRGCVMEMHDDAFEHPDGQHMQARSSAVDVVNDVLPNLGATGDLGVIADWDQYSVLPRANGIFYRPGWDYYPYECAETGAVTWSGRIGRASYEFDGEDPDCSRRRNVGTEYGIPQDVEQVRFVYELYASCDVFGVDPDECTNVSNFTPLLDNIQVRFTRVPIAPQVAFEAGTQFQDGYAQSLILDPGVPGRADVTRNVNGGNTAPYILGDSLVVAGPIPKTGTEWEARLWFRIRRPGPNAGQSASYIAWRDLYGGPAIVGENADFAWAYMDSVQTGTSVSKNRFASYLREDDPHYDSGAGEQSDVNEIIRDDVLYPGTAIDYFCSAAYSATPDLHFLLPDTTGGFFAEFEILPRWVDDGGTTKFPCLLYVDAFNRGAELFIENALDALGLVHDRYDYLDATSDWVAPMARGGDVDSNNGVSLAQLLGYRGILLNTGTFSNGALWPEDWIFFSDWLDAVTCGANSQMQGFLANGDGIATNLSLLSPSVLSDFFGVIQLADDYSDFADDEGYCVRLEEPLVNARYGTSNSNGDYDYDAWGNWCPQLHTFDVLQVTSTGVGNRAYVNASNDSGTEWAAVVNEDAVSNFRTVLDGVSWHHLSERDGFFECVGDSAHIVSAAFNEIAAGLEWVFGAGPGNIPGLCENPCVGFELGGERVARFGGTTQLFQNSPNPFNPRTSLRFSLQTDGPVVLTIHDVSGRRVRTLLDDVKEAGMHECVWDGTNDAGNPLPAGVFWSQLSTGSYHSNRKMILLR